MSLEKFGTSKIPNIAFFGRCRSGKDSCFEILQELGFPVRRIAYGDAMKEMFHLENPDIPRVPKRADLYQQYGQAIREKDPDIFVRPTMSKLWFEQQLDKSHKRKSIYICTDVRQQNEYDALKKAGFKFVKVHSAKEVRIQRMLSAGELVTEEILNAPTEELLEGFHFDFITINNWTRDELKRQVVELVYKLISEEEGK